MSKIVGGLVMDHVVMNTTVHVVLSSFMEHPQYLGVRLAIGAAHGVIPPLNPPEAPQSLGHTTEISAPQPPSHENFLPKIFGAGVYCSAL